MNENTVRSLFLLLGCAISGSRLDESGMVSVKNAHLTELAELAKQHDVAHLLNCGFEINSIKTDGCELTTESVIAVYRYEQQSYELGRLCKAFESAKIPFIPLKGSVIRKYYPEPWMRTSCDIDIFVNESDSERAAEVVESECGYVRRDKGSHDISMCSPSGVHLELHFDLVEDWLNRPVWSVLADVWNGAYVDDGCAYRYSMSDEMFYFYHVAHMAKHFQNGGCGIRPFIDLWILNCVATDGSDARKQLLERGGLSQFAAAAEELCRVWFEGAQHSRLTLQMENYVLRGGVYGSTENRINIQQQKKGGRLKFAFSMIILPYNVIKFYYPILQRFPWLTPAVQVYRWFKLLFLGFSRHSVNEIKYSNSISKTDAKSTKQFLIDLGLM